MFRKNKISFIIFLFFFSVNSIINSSDIYKSIFKNVTTEDAQLVLKHTSDIMQHFYGEIEINTFSKPVNVRCIITMNGKPIYSKSENIQSNSKALIKINSFKLNYGYYEVNLYINNIKRNWLYLHNKQGTGNNIRLHIQDPSELPKDLTGLYSINILIINENTWKKLNESQKKNISAWLKMGGVLEIKGKSRYNFYKENIDSPLFPYKNLMSRINIDSKSYLTHKNDKLLKPWATKSFNTIIFIPIIIIFAVILGPGIVIFSRKRKKSILMLIFIPIFSIIFSLIILTISFFQNGITTKVHQVSAAYLDQLDEEIFIHQSAVIESPLGGPRVIFPDDSYISILDNNYANCDIKNGKMIFSPNSIPPKIPVNFYMSRYYSDKRKLEIKENNEGLIIVNALGTTISNLRIHTKKGIYIYENNILPGKKIQLTDTDNLVEKKSRYLKINDQNFISNKNYNSLTCSSIFEGGYSAELKENVFGVELCKNRRKLFGENKNILIGLYKRY